MVATEKSAADGARLAAADLMNATLFCESLPVQKKSQSLAVESEIGEHVCEARFENSDHEEYAQAALR